MSEHLRVVMVGELGDLAEFDGRSGAVLMGSRDAVRKAGSLIYQPVNLVRVGSVDSMSGSSVGIVEPDEPTPFEPRYVRPPGSSMAPLRHTVAGIECVTIPYADYDAMRSGRSVR